MVDQQNQEQQEGLEDPKPVPAAQPRTPGGPGGPKVVHRVKPGTPRSAGGPVPVLRAAPGTPGGPGEKPKKPGEPGGPILSGGPVGPLGQPEALPRGVMPGAPGAPGSSLPGPAPGVLGTPAVPGPLQMWKIKKKTKVEKRLAGTKVSITLVVL